jgi:tetratricopeptide (TPR) repeat protein
VTTLVSYTQMTENFSNSFAEGFRALREKRLPAARAIFLDGVRNASEQGDRPVLAEAFSGLAAAESEIGNCPAARHHYANAAVLYRDIGPPTMLACTIGHEAELLVQMNQPAEAEPLYLEAEKIYRQNGEESALDLANTLRGLGRLKEKTGELQAARSLWQEACEIYARREVAEAVAECGRKLSSFDPKV